MHFLKIIFLRGELLLMLVVIQYRIMRTIPRKFGKLHMFSRIFWHENWDISIQSMAILCPFLLNKRIRKWTLKTKQFQWHIYRALQFRICLKLRYILCMLSQNGSFRENVIVIISILLLNYVIPCKNIYAYSLNFNIITSAILTMLVSNYPCIHVYIRYTWFNG